MDSASVKRVTTVLEPDTEINTMQHTDTEVELSGKVQSENRDKEIEDCLNEYKDIMTKQPGLTEKAIFGIETGHCRPLAQRPYNTFVLVLTRSWTGY